MWISCWSIKKKKGKNLFNYGKRKFNMRWLHWYILKGEANKSCSGAKPLPVSVKIFKYLIWVSWAYWEILPLNLLLNYLTFGSFGFFSKQESMQGMILNQRAKVCIIWISNMSLLSLVSVMHLHYYESILFCFSRDYCCLHAVIYLHCCRYIYTHTYNVIILYKPCLFQVACYLCSLRFLVQWTWVKMWDVGHSDDILQ